MSDERIAYRQIFKATSIFGGVQFFNIFTSIVKSKIIAVLLGADGVGLFGLFNSTLDLLKTSTGLGLSSSAVRDISLASGTNDLQKISDTVKTLRRWVYWTGCFGSIITVILSPYLSEWTFGSRNYTWSFVYLSISLFLLALSSGQLAVLQGLRKVNYLAKAGIGGSLVGLIVSFPLFYFFRMDGIVPSILVSGFCTLFFSSYFARKIKLPPVYQSYSTSFKQGIDMAKLGSMMMLSSLLVVLTSYIFRAYLMNKGGLGDVGIFQSGFVIVEGYLGLIFNAMATDYYPRLSVVNQDNHKVKNVVNQQAEIGLLIAGPMIIFSLFVMPWIIRLFYAKDFLSALPYVNWALIGNIFKIGSWAMGFILLAKGKSKVFICTAIGFNSLFLANNIIGYNIYGTEGIGFAYLLNYMIHFLVLFLVCRILFGFNYGRDFWKILSIVLVFSVSAFGCQYINTWIKWPLGVLLVSLIAWFSFIQLDKRLNLRQLISKRLNFK